MTVPPPFTMGEWMERARQIQRQMDLSKALRDGANVSGQFQQKQQTSSYRSYPNNSNNNNWRSNNTGGQSNGNQGTQQSAPSGAKTFGGTGEPMEIDRRM